MPRLAVTSERDGAYTRATTLVTWNTSTAICAATRLTLSFEVTARNRSADPTCASRCTCTSTALPATTRAPCRRTARCTRDVWLSITVTVWPRATDSRASADPTRPYPTTT